MQLLALPEDRLDGGILGSRSGKNRCKRSDTEQLCSGRQNHQTLELFKMRFPYSLDTIDGSAQPHGNQYADI